MQYKSLEIFDEEIYQYVGNSDTQILHSLSGISFPDPRYKMLINNADNYSIEYVYSGEGVIEISSGIQKVYAGDFFILHPGRRHHYFANPENPWKKIFFTIDGDPSFFKTLLKLYNIDNTEYIPKANSPFRLEEIFTLVKNDDGHITNRLERLVFSMVMDISNHIKQSPVENTNMLLAKKYIDRHIHSRITIDEVAKEVGLSPNHLSSEFKKAFNQSPVKYILNSKIEFSKTLLAETSMTVFDIAMAFSFTDASHYTHTFVQFAGMTPGEYRKKGKQHKPDDDKEELVMY